MKDPSPKTGGLIGQQIGRGYFIPDLFGIVVLWLAYVACMFFMLGLLVLGAMKFYMGLRIGFGTEMPEATRMKEALDHSIHALEYFLLAPLGSFLIRCLSIYQWDIGRRSE